MKEEDTPPGEPAVAGTVTPQRVDDILRRARVELSPGSADKARGRTAFGLSEPMATTTTGGATGWAALGASGQAGALVSMLLLGAGILIGYGLGHSHSREVAVSRAAPQGQETGEPAAAATSGAAEMVPAERNTASSAVAPVDGGGATADERATASVAVAKEAARPPRRGSASARKARANSTSSSDARVGTPRDGEELGFMRRIERALRSDQPALALALLAEVEARFPRSALEEERLAASVIARCELREPGFAQRASNFLSGRPRSVYRTRVMEACGMLDVSTANDNRAATDDGKRLGGD